MTELRVPRWGLTMEESQISVWLKKVGDRVQKGEAIVEIASDKVENEVESEGSGVVTKILAAEGDTVIPGQVIAEIEED